MFLNLIYALKYLNELHLVLFLIEGRSCSSKMSSGALALLALF